MENAKSIMESVKDSAMLQVKKGQAKAHDLKWKVKKWYRTHKDDIVRWAPVALSATALSYRVYMQNKKTAGEKLRDRAEHQIYDHRTGLRWELKRPLTNQENRELKRFMEDGASMEDALELMGVLK